MSKYHGLLHTWNVRLVYRATLRLVMKSTQIDALEFAVGYHSSNYMCTTQICLPLKFYILP